MNLGLTHPWSDTPLVSVLSVLQPSTWCVVPHWPLLLASQDNFEKTWEKLHVSRVFFLGWESSFPASSSDVALGNPNPRWGLRHLCSQDRWCFTLGELETQNVKCSQKVKMETQSAEKLIFWLNFHVTFLYIHSSSVFDLCFLYWNALQSSRLIKGFLKSQR